MRKSRNGLVIEDSLVVEIHGELGNQLFEWAAGVAVSSKNSQSLSLCLLPGVSYRLDSFIGPPLLEEITNSPRAITSIVSRIINRLSRQSRFIGGLIEGALEGNRYIERSLNFDTRLLAFNQYRELYGYFQSWRYLDNISNEIRTQLQLRNESNEYLQLHAKLHSSPFTAVHVRRGSSGAAILASDYHGLLPLDYYETAVSKALKLGAPSRLILFTDNPVEAKRAFDFSNLSFDEVIGPKDLTSQAENLVLMSSAEAIVGANSSYSWWAAFLRDEPNKVRVFPRQWYMDPNISTTDLLPTHWITVGFRSFLNESKERVLKIHD